MNKSNQITGKERFFDEDDIIVSKTDLKGRITYANRVFLEIADYTEEEVLGQPHAMIRHPHMPRSVFKLLWDTIQSGHEIFAYVVNRTKNGDHYWVLAHVTPSFDADGKIDGYHSNRRVPDRQIIDGTIKPLYAKILAEEERHHDRKAGLQAGYLMLTGLLEQQGVDYDQFIAALTNGRDSHFKTAA
ncbi:MAG: PAS domain-containing protein [Nisaea sp.]|jgi:PAS domain S-box-containing protein|uniref:PAS domain-containing protein n=1 Tax=Nisaea sp. TaxID=2024842 RepID=UPI001B0DFE1E|nr:PAS domain-containing protein [Nisaea sp.]MBO6561950.1 PAS domain-containing protein [Nisaea sp.]